MFDNVVILVGFLIVVGCIWWLVAALLFCGLIRLFAGCLLPFACVCFVSFDFGWFVVVVV